MAASEDLGKSDYLIGYYVEAAVALSNFEESDDEGKSSQARDALNKAASRICEALTRLVDDRTFWDALAALREPIHKGEPAIRQMLDDIDLFIAQEEAVLLGFKLPPAIVRRLLSDLTLTLKTFRTDSDGRQIAALEGGIRDARDTICQIAKEPSHDEPRHQFFRISQATREALSVLGGVVTIVLDAAGYIAGHPVALPSVVGGAASSLGFLEWLKRKGSRRG